MGHGTFADMTNYKVLPTYREDSRVILSQNLYPAQIATYRMQALEIS